jgi:hypothetical protein
MDPAPSQSTDTHARQRAPHVAPSRAPDRARRRTALIMLAALAGALAVTHLHAVGRLGWLPPCAWHTLTHTYCPGCGTGRCLAALLRGDVRQAAAYNVLTLVALPLLVLWAVAALIPARWSFRRDLSLHRHVSPRATARLAWLVAAAVILFGVLRNVPAYPFTLLTPHVAR